MSATKRFSYRSMLDEPSQTVFNWHKNPGAFERLMPPWLKVKVLNRIGDGIHNNSRLEIEVDVGFGLRSHQILEMRDYIEGYQFRDVQIKGPYPLWEHTHRVKPLTEESCEIEDIIEYRLPKRIFFINSWLKKRVEQELATIFRYRHQVLKNDIALHKGVKPMKIVITGSTGLIGSSLIPFLTTGGHEILRLVRARSTLKEDETAWDPERGVISPERLEGYDAVIHLAGENIASDRWTEEKKQKILDSRIKGTTLLSEALAGLKNPPKVLISASAIGFYGDQGSKVITEQSPPGNKFVSYVCQKWEEATKPASDSGIRVANMRIGLLLSPKGGVLQQILTPFKLGLGGVLGSGQQYYSWIAMDDLLNAILFLLQNESIRGPVNFTSPNPVTNEEFTKTLGSVLNRPTFMWMPETAVRMAFGELADNLLLSSFRVEPQVLEQNGFKFLFPKLENALRFLLGKSD